MKRMDISNASVYMYENFLTVAECGHCIKLILRDRRRSTTTSGDSISAVSDYRTSSTCTMPSGDEVIRGIDIRICDALKLSSDLGEPIQGQFYEPGQYFKEHTDYFDPGTTSYAHHTKGRGNRTWTFMIYLNNTVSGGCTKFPKLKLEFAPKQGCAVFWDNQHNGELNKFTLHQGMPVTTGFKAIITKWFREFC